MNIDNILMGTLARRDLSLISSANQRTLDLLLATPGDILGRYLSFFEEEPNSETTERRCAPRKHGKYGPYSPPRKIRRIRMSPPPCAKIESHKSHSLLRGFARFALCHISRFETYVHMAWVILKDGYAKRLHSRARFFGAV